jgi:hypothetical protein
MPSNITHRFVLKQILSEKDRDDVIESIQQYLIELAQEARQGLIPLEKFTITKASGLRVCWYFTNLAQSQGLTKHPKDYKAYDCSWYWCTCW